MRNKVIVIAGASKGIGLAILNDFCHSENIVICLARSKIESPPKNVVEIYCDVSDAESNRCAIEEIKKRYTAIDILIYCSGISGSNDFFSDNPDNSLWRKTLETNLVGAIDITQRIAPLITPETGRVVFLGSISSFRGSLNLPIYATSKHALLGFTRSLAKILAPKRVTVNAVCPGFVDTEMVENYLKDINATRDELLNTIPFKRFVSAAEVSGAVMFLCSDMAKNISGQSIVIDCGLLA